jgi:tetratricopeptide (TPR) repeat protein
MSDWLEAEAHADRALELYERGRLNEAESELRKAIAVNPDQADWHFNLGLTLEAAGRDAEAVTSYERAVELSPEEVEPLLAAAAVATRLRRWSQALAWLDRAIAIEPGADAPYAARIDVLARSGDHDEAEACFYLAQHALAEPSAACLAAIAESLMEQDLYARAGWCLREALRLDPQIPRARARLAAVLAATGKPQRALQMYLRDLRDDPGNVDTLLDYGELLIDLGRWAEAAEKFRRVLELEPANVDAHERLARVALSAGQLEQAHVEFELVLKLDPGYPEVRVALAEVLLRRGRLDEARAHLRSEMDRRERREEGGGDGAEQEAGRLDPDPGDEDALADVLLEAGMDAEAARTLERAIARRGESAQLLRRLALARFRSGNDAGGVTASRRILRIDPSCVAAIYNLALAALRSGQLRVAGGWIARGLRVDRHDDGLRRLRMRHRLLWLKSLLR